MSLTVRTPREIALDIPEVTLADGTVLPALGTVRFPVSGAVHPALTSIFPQKLVTGDFTRDTEQINSSHDFSDWTGGVGVLHMDESTQTDRFWDSTANTLWRNQLTLPWQAVDTGSGGSPSTAQARCGAVLSGAFYVAFDNLVRAYNNSTSTWGASLVTLSANAVDAIVYKGRMYFAYGTGIQHSANGSAWTNDTTHAGHYLAVWDSRLWLIKNDGSAFWVYDGTTWTAKAVLEQSSTDITGLGTFYAADNSEVIYAHTRTGPYLYDATSDKWLRGRFQMPRQKGSGTAHTVYRDGLYTSAGLTVYQFTGGNVSPMGLDREWGLPSYLSGQITWMTATPAWLISVLDSTAPSTSVSGEFESGLAPGWGSVTFTPTSGYSSAWAWNDKGWHSLWRSSSTGSGSTWAMVTDLFGETRLWIGADNRVYKIQLPDGILNPLQSTNALPFAPSGELVTPWFDAQWSELDKLAIQLRLRTKQCTSTETVTVYYATDDSESWTLLGTIDENGEAHFDFGGQRGQVFSNIRFRFVLARGSSALATPVLNFAVISYEKLLEPKFGYTTTILLTEPYDGRSVAEMSAALEQALSVKEKLAFCYRNTMALDQTRYVKISRYAASDLGGEDGRGRADISFIEP